MVSTRNFFPPQGAFISLGIMPPQGTMGRVQPIGVPGGPGPGPPTPTITKVTIDTSTDTTALYAGQHRKLAQDSNGRYWLFWYDGADIVYSGSADLSSWSAKASIYTGANGLRNGYCNMFIDGLTIYVIWGYYVNPWFNVKFRKGTISADSISWGAITTVVQENNKVTGTGFTKATGGRLWVLVHLLAGNVVRSYYSDNDGTNWSSTNLTSLTYSDSTGGNDLKAMTSDKVMAIVKPSGNSLRAAIYNAGWSAWTDLSTSTLAGNVGSLCATSLGDIVDVVWLEATTYHIKHKRYDGGWGAANTVILSQSADSSPSLAVDPDTGDLYCFWAQNDVIYYKKFDGSSWDADPTTVIDESSDTLTDGFGIVAKEELVSSVNGSLWYVAYLANVGSPYDVRIAYLHYV